MIQFETGTRLVGSLRERLDEVRAILSSYPYRLFIPTLRD
jgi:hypothetical protein